MASFIMSGTASATLISRLGGQAYYDTVLDITWAADANINGADTWDNQVAWAAGLTLGGISGWRLPTLSPINGASFQTTFSNNATTDFGTADSAGWVDGSGNPVSEMGHLFYATLGNMGVCIPNFGGLSTSCITQTGFGLSNTGPFSNVQSNFYWFGLESAPSTLDTWLFDFSGGRQGMVNKGSGLFAWAVHSGDVAASVPEPTSLTLLGLGLAGIGLSRRRKRRL